MYAPVTLTTVPLQVVFLSRSESSVRTDSKALRELGVSGITHLRDSAEALAFLEKKFKATQSSAIAATGEKSAEQLATLVLCDEHLADIPASVFLYTLAGHPELHRQPAMILTSSTESSRRLRPSGVYLLERPYMIRDMARMILKAVSPMRRLLRRTDFESASAQTGILLQPRQRKVKSAVTAPVTTSDWFEKGMACLRDNRLREAEAAFLRVLDRQEEHIDAALGLAKVYGLQGDETGMRRGLLRAAAASLRNNKHDRAAQISALLPTEMRDNIFLHEALSRMAEGEFKAAALGFLDAGKDSGGVPLHYIISRACQLTPSPEDCMRKLCDALTGMGYRSTAERLRQRLLNYPEFEPGQEPPTWLDAYPKVKEAVDVASYTAWAWKHA